MNLSICSDKENNIYKILVKKNNEVICEYCMEVTDIVSNVGVRIIYTTLCAWAVLDFCLLATISIEVNFFDFEKEYIENLYNFCCKLYKNNFNLDVATLKFENQYNYFPYMEKNMNDEFFLGYTGGKDSTLSKILLNDLNKKINYYEVSYDNNTVRGYGRIFNSIFNKKIYKENSITGYKESSNLVSFHQADDIHVTFVAPYIYDRNIFPSNIAVGLPYDAIHSFENGIPDLVPTETLESLKYLEKLMHNYGFNKYKIVSPIGTLHTFGVYNLLSKIIDIDKLLQLDSCWEYQYNNNPCGMCPKCQRLKFVLKKCFNIDYLPNVPLLNITSSDFLFGSIHANKLIKENEIGIVLNNQIFHDDLSFENEFTELLNYKYDMSPITLKNIQFENDNQRWDVLLEEIVKSIGIDYREISDVKINSDDVDYLPFEKYYNWGRNNKVLNCCDKQLIKKKILIRK